MVVREYATCEECGQAHTLRVGLGSQPVQKHAFACVECKMDMGLTVTIGEGISLGPNARRIAPADDAPIVNLHPDFVFDKSEIGAADAFPSLNHGAKLVSAMLEARRKTGVPDDYAGPMMPPIVEEWNALRATWALTRNGKSKLAQKRMENYLAQGGYPDAPENLADWLFQFCARLTLPAYEPHFEGLVEQLQQAMEADGFPDFLDAYDKSMSIEHGRRIFELMRSYLGNFSEFSQVHGAIAAGLEVGEEQAVASIDFDSTRMIYGDAFEAFASNCETLAYLNNLIAGRPFDKFARMDRAKYLTLDKASRFGPFRDNPPFAAICTEADNQLRNATHHGGVRFDKSEATIYFRAGKGGQGEERVLGYAEFLARTSKLFIQAILLLRLELLIAHRFNIRWPL